MDECRRRAAGALFSSASGLLERTGDVHRIARLVALLEGTGDELQTAVVARILDRQAADGGWDSVEESLWCVVALQAEPTRECLSAAERGLNWLSESGLSCGGWSSSGRGAPHAVLTGLMLTLLPGLAREKDYEWLCEAWRRDLGQEVKLCYKGALYLSSSAALGRADAESKLYRDTLDYLASDANDDGGFGPWRGHPIGSDPWSTGICLVGLCAMPEATEPLVVERAANWLKSAQLESGFWPCHFIDEGSVYAYWGLSKAAAVLGTA